MIAECGYCQRLQLTPEQRETEPWPPGEINSCEFHTRVLGEIDEARAMEAR